MALKLRLDRQAKLDLIEIRNYLLAHAGNAAAQRVRNHLRARMQILQRMPLIGVATSEPGIRILAPTRYPYRIYYTIVGDAVVVLHVRHSARRDPALGDLR